MKQLDGRFVKQQNRESKEATIVQFLTSNSGLIPDDFDWVFAGFLAIFCLKPPAVACPAA